MPYKEVDKFYIVYNLRTAELLDCALIGACTVIRSNTVINSPIQKKKKKKEKKKKKCTDVQG